MCCGIPIIFCCVFISPVSCRSPQPGRLAVPEVIRYPVHFYSGIRQLLSQMYSCSLFTYYRCSLWTCAPPHSLRYAKRSLVLARVQADIKLLMCTCMIFSFNFVSSRWGRVLLREFPLSCWGCGVRQPTLFVKIFLFRKRMPSGSLVFN